MSTEGSGATRAGGPDFHNEDAFLVEEGLGLYVVCDGASGKPAGEVAALLAAEAVEEFVERAGDDVDLRRGRVARSVVERAMAHAMATLAVADEEHPELRGLATTITMLLAHGSHGVIGHRGDSRAYLIRREQIRQLTVDDELTEVGDGHEDDAEIDVFALSLHGGDTIVLCTDGAEEVVQDDAIVRAAADLAPHVLASRIVSAAHRRQPGQDATAVVVQMRSDREPGWLALSLPPRRTAFGHTLQVA